MATTQIRPAQLQKEWWEELGRTTLGSAASTITVNFTAKKYLRILVRVYNSGTITPILRFNNDSGSNYAYRISYNTAADTTATSASSIFIDSAVAYNSSSVWEVFNNLAGNEKPVYGLIVAENTAGVTNVPGRGAIGAKWGNTSAQINRVDIINTNTGNFNTSSEVVVLGHD